MIGSKKTILITGINGFIGTHLYKYLANDYNVVGLTSTIKDNKNEKRIKMFDAEEKSLISLFNEFEIFAIINLATVYNSIDGNLNKLLNTNILLPIRLMELANEYGVKFFINTDTFFNNYSNYSYLGEYTLSKRHCLDWLTRNVKNCLLINMKLFHVYGPNDSKSKFVPKIIEELKSNKEVVRLTLGEQKRDFIYVTDVSSAYKKVLETNFNNNKLFYEFEVGTGIETTIKEFVIKLKKNIGSKSELSFGALPYRENEIMESKANNHKLIDLNWRPTYTLDEGIKKTLEIL